MPQHATNLAELFQSLDITTVTEVITLDDLSDAFDATGITEAPPSQEDFPVCEQPPHQKVTALQAPPPLHRKRIIGPNASHHELHMDYLVYDLLPRGTDPHLARPRDVTYRQQPHLDWYHIHNTHLGCVVRLNTPLRRNQYSRAPSYQWCGDLVSMINRLSDAPGVSTLELVCFQTDGRLQYNMRLTTTWMTATGQCTEIKMCGCWADEFSGFIAALSGVVWADVLDDLVNRASDLSYLHVRDRMFKHSVIDAQQEMNACNWGTESANFILASCFELNRREEGDSGSFIDPLTIARCGHTIRMSREYLYFVMSHDECVAYKCPTCGHKVMANAEMHKIGLIEDSKPRRAYVALDDMWYRIYKDMNHYVVFQVRNHELRDALRDSLALLKEPASIMHPSQNSQNMVETQVLLETFNARLAYDNGVLTVAPGKTALLLAKIATAALRKRLGVDESVKGVRYVPLGYGRFMQRWLKGAVVLLAARVEAKTTCVVDELSSLLGKMGENEQVDPDDMMTD